MFETLEDICRNRMKKLNLNQNLNLPNGFSISAEIYARKLLYYLL